ncbi:MAG TPA: hypothetical protein VH643_25005 [Gemmataceae bacterium]|jgi:DNA repair ATPase RecN
MNTSIRTAIVAVVVSVLAVCVFSLRFACTPADLSAIHRNEKLEQLRAATFRRVEVRQRMVRELIDRRRTLAEAIERLEELDREWPDYSEASPRVPALGTREERSYRYIRADAEEILRDRPEEAAAVLRRLEEEYQQLRAGEPVPSSTTPVQGKPNP